MKAGASMVPLDDQDVAEADKLFGGLHGVQRDSALDFISRATAVPGTAPRQSLSPASSNASDQGSLPVGAEVRAHQARSRSADDEDSAAPTKLSPAEKTFLAGLARLAVKAMLGASGSQLSSPQTHSIETEDAT